MQNIISAVGQNLTMSIHILSNWFAQCTYEIIWNFNFRL